MEGTPSNYCNKFCYHFLLDLTHGMLQEKKEAANKEVPQKQVPGNNADTSKKEAEGDKTDEKKEEEGQEHDRKVSAT